MVKPGLNSDWIPEGLEPIIGLAKDDAGNFIHHFNIMGFKI